MSLIEFDEVSLSFGERQILREASFVLEERERVCLIGRNGAGKTTIFRLMLGEQIPDEGEIRFSGDLQVARLEQELPDSATLTVFEYVSDALAELKNWIEQFQARPAGELSAAEERYFAELQHRIEAHGGWNIDTQVDRVLTQMNLPAQMPVRALSGGWQRRVALARALVTEPDVLLLDEPTNHLDLETIGWLERRIANWNGAVIFITHDRAFLKKLATRIVDIDRGQLRSWPGDYDRYLDLKAQAIEEENERNALFDKRLAKEEAWIREGIKARRTRNEGRVRKLLAMREQAGERIKRERAPRITVEQAEISGRKVIEARKLQYRYEDTEPLIEGVSLRIMRGDRIGFIGNNGVGKSTLLKLLLGRLTPQAGTIKFGTNLQIAYFDQTREQLDPDKTVAQIIGDGRDYISINGKETHVIGYLRGFLFSAERAMTPVRVLSGGECNRVILARLFTRPSNLLVLDEPTNDLDVETLEVLEAQLVDYAGTLIVVSHDRDFLDNVVTSTLVFEDAARIQRYAGAYSDWMRQGHRLNAGESAPESKSSAAAKAHNADRAGKKADQGKPGKLSYKLQFELDQLPERIEALEGELRSLQTQTSDSEFYAQPFEQTQPVLERLNQCQTELDAAMERWLELDAMQLR